MLCTQYFYKTFITNHARQIVIYTKKKKKKKNLSIEFKLKLIITFYV